MKNNAHVVAMLIDDTTGLPANGTYNIAVDTVDGKTEGYARGERYEYNYKNGFLSGEQKTYCIDDVTNEKNY